MTTDRDVLYARAYLSAISSPPAPHLIDLIADIGAVEAAARVYRGDIPAAIAAEIQPTRRTSATVADTAVSALLAAQAHGIKLITPEHPHWPHSAFTVTGGGCPVTAPVALWVRGTAALTQLTERAVAVSGSRAATGYGLHIAGELGAQIAQRGHTVVTGGALGIDIAAHRGAQAADGATLTVLPCGLDRIYPSAHTTQLLASATDTRTAGLLVSEYPPGAVPARARFLARQRLLAAFGTRGVVIVEASARSAALALAEAAISQHRPLSAVPGPLTSLTSAGCHTLVRSGRAALITTPAAFAEQLSQAAEPRTAGEHTATASADPTLPAPVAQLLARCWDIEGYDGGWNGGDIVDLLCQWFDEFGADITHPALGQGGPTAYDAWSRADLLRFAHRYGHRVARAIPTTGPTPEPSTALGRASAPPADLVDDETTRARRPR
ncbi:DNA-processing protein DprA [Pseudonocardia kunmingensis]|uniref:DNA processing protein n=1 Tax=Pseudonocardia kunmingensis TaxID=630975 RepID=A0A543CXD5_9PSEU|nr:DNA-processing protein DprA [Pseudonocardia kunmingensis]TQM01699.1 DNA processing protein [Pseudonocardia kunmingensis]